MDQKWTKNGSKTDQNEPKKDLLFFELDIATYPTFRPHFGLVLASFQQHFGLILTSFSVPIIPEFLYTIRHQNDRFTTPRTTPTTTTTSTPLTPFAFNDTLYDLDPEAPIDYMLSNDDNEDKEPPTVSSDEYIDYESMDERDMTPAQKYVKNFH